MPADQVADGVWLIRGTRTNLAVIDDGGSRCLVDTGYRRDWKRLSAGLEAMGRGPADVEAVLFTHAHVDHVGNAERLRTEYHAPVHAHEAEAALVRGERCERIGTGYMVSRLWWPKMMSFVFTAVRSGGAGHPSVGAVATFGRPDALDLPGGPVPIFTPGHTSGHCAFHLPDRGVLLSGDALVTLDALTLRTGPRLLSRAFNHDQAEAVRSLERLRPLQAEMVLPG